MTTTESQGVFVMPDGYSRLEFLQFDPSSDIRIRLTSQKSKVDLISGVTLNQVNNPFLPVKFPMSIDDRFILSVYTVTGTVADVSISAAFV